MKFIKEIETHFISDKVTVGFHSLTAQLIIVNTAEQEPVAMVLLPGEVKKIYELYLKFCDQFLERIEQDEEGFNQTMKLLGMETKGNG